MWVLTAIAALVLLPCAALVVWEFVAKPYAGTDYALVPFVVIFIGLPAFVAGSVTGLIALTMRSKRLAGTRPAPAGWYPEPSSESGLRFWDGREWTESTARD